MSCKQLIYENIDAIDACNYPKPRNVADFHP